MEPLIKAYISFCQLRLKALKSFQNPKFDVYIETLTKELNGISQDQELICKCFSTNCENEVRM